MSLIAIRDTAKQIALGEEGTREVGGQNMGPGPTKYLAAVNLPPGHPWCCAGVIWCYREATIRAGSGLRMPLIRTAKCARLWARTPDLWKSNVPTIGAIYIHLDDPENPNSTGHCGIVLGLAERSLLGIEFNTNAVGSHNGDRVRTNTRRQSYVNAGYIDIGREGPVIDSPSVA
jgi:hypothetical protein